MTLGLLGLGIYFSVLLFRGLKGYLLFRKVRPTALVTWRVQRPANFKLLLGLGIVSTALTILNSYLGRPFHHVYGQAVMALYFILMVPLSSTIHLGLYRDGVWADTGFLPYARIGRMAFREQPEIVLILLPRGGGSPSFRLPVPPEEYGSVRKLLEEKRRANVLNVESGILGL
jgi:hypothetical protein